jgi:hypothetical protein
MTARNIRKILGSFLFGLGAMNLICFVSLDLYWTATGSHVTDAEHGYIYRHQVKWLIAYFSRPMELAEALLLGSVVVLVLTGYALAPKIWERKLYGTTWRWAQKTEYDTIARNGLIAGFVSSPFLVYFIGPTIVRWAEYLSTAI